MTVKEIVKEYLETNGFDGLFCGADCGCDCDLSNLMHCEDSSLKCCEKAVINCKPVFQANCDLCESKDKDGNCSLGFGYCIQPRKE